MEISSRTKGRRCLRRMSMGMLALTAMMPLAAQAHPEVSVDAAAQNDLIAVTRRAGAASLRQQLKVGTAEVTQQAGPLRFGVAMQYGKIVVPSPEDYLAHEMDHRSLRVDRELFAGGTASLALYKGWRMQAGAGRVQLRLHDDAGDMARRRSLNEGTLTGWRMMAGFEHPLGLGVVTLGWQSAHYAGGQGRDPGQPRRGSAGRVGLVIASPL